MAREKVSVLVARRPGGRNLPLPAYQSAGSSGLDLLAAVKASLTLKPGVRAVVPTGISIALPPGYEAQVRGRSGLAARHGLCVINGPGTVDSDYRGEIGVILANLGDKPFTVERGMRIAQLVVCPVAAARWVELRSLPGTARGHGGFGSSGMETAPASRAARRKPRRSAARRAGVIRRSSQGR